MVIADIGAGGGYYCFRFAKLVGDKGRVYAADLNQDYLQLIEAAVTRHGLRSKLKPGGRIAIIEHTNSGCLGHATPPEKIREAMRKAGYRTARVHDFLPRQSFAVFVPE
jgi:predicted methyltransferase